MTLEMHFRELVEEALEQRTEQTAIRMLKVGKLSVEEVSLYSGLTVEQVLKLKNELQYS